MMKTTLNIDCDVWEMLKTYANRRSITPGEAASELLRQSLTAPVETRIVNGFCTVVLPKGSSKITSEHVKRLLEGRTDRVFT
jgi:hypothetical protein